MHDVREMPALEEPIHRNTSENIFTSARNVPEPPHDPQAEDDEDRLARIFEDRLPPFIGRGVLRLGTIASTAAPKVGDDGGDQHPDDDDEPPWADRRHVVDRLLDDRPSR